MYALTFHDLETALNASERSEQALIDLQIDRGLLRELMVAHMSQANSKALLEQASQHNRYSGLFQLTEDEPLLTEDKPVSVHHMNLEGLIKKGAMK